MEARAKERVNGRISVSGASGADVSDIGRISVSGASGADVSDIGRINASASGAGAQKPPDPS